MAVLAVGFVVLSILGWYASFIQVLAVYGEVMSLRERFVTVPKVVLMAVVLFGWLAPCFGEGELNGLKDEKSSYLLAHASNPVNWYPWGEEAFEKARKENKPIFLSVGYSACHWCHVMEDESFKNEAVARVLNESFIAIKVDREERPDVDKVYMTFLQATTGRGGWPMSVWLTPDLKPFVGGVYFTPEKFTGILNQISGAWESDRESIVASSEEVVTALRKMMAPGVAAKEGSILAEAVEERAFEGVSAVFDGALGGFGGAPKFPRPVMFNFLSNVYAGKRGSEEGERALEMMLFTLRKMAAGGIHDHLGGGFHRYSVDAFWHVPHFEKMLYDQAQLAMAYGRAYQITKDPVFENVMRGVLDYVLEDMTGPEGGFYSAEDADSLVRAGDEEHKEGVFYVWRAGEIEDVLGAEGAEIFGYQYGVQTGGNAPSGSDDLGEFIGKNILIQRHTDEEAAVRFGMSVEEVRGSLAESRRLLLARRNERPRPRRDEKVVVAWNGLMISGFARGGQVLGDAKYSDAARRGAEFVRENLYREPDGVLLRNYMNGASPLEGFVEDYAFLIQGLLDLYETSFDVQWVEWALRLQAKQDELFWDDEAGGYFSTTGEDKSILMRLKEDYDGAEPSPNSIAAQNLLRLSKVLGDSDLRGRAERVILAFSAQIEGAQVAMPEMLVALDWLGGEPKQIVIAGERGAADTLALLEEVYSHFIPDKVVLLADGGAGQKFLSEGNEFIGSMGRINGEAAAYVCEDFVCQLPVTKVADLSKLLVGSGQREVFTDDSTEGED